MQYLPATRETRHQPQPGVPGRCPPCGRRYPLSSARRRCAARRRHRALRHRPACRAVWPARHAQRRRTALPRWRPAAQRTAGRSRRAPARRSCTRRPHPLCSFIAALGLLEASNSHWPAAAHIAARAMLCHELAAAASAASPSTCMLLHIIKQARRHCQDPVHASTSGPGRSAYARLCEAAPRFARAQSSRSAATAPAHC